MDKYHVTIRPEALQMLDVIYDNICTRCLDNSTADNLISAIEKNILSLETMPQRGAEVSTGVYANRGYRKLIVKNHIIIYTVLEERREVVIVFVKSIKMDM